MSATSERWAIWCDYQITRRKRYHACKSPEGDWCYQSRLLWECVEWMDANGHTEYDLRPGGIEPSDSVQRLTVRKE